MHACLPVGLPVWPRVLCTQNGAQLSCTQNGAPHALTTAMLSRVLCTQNGAQLSCTQNGSK